MRWSEGDLLAYQMRRQSSAAASKPVPPSIKLPAANAHLLALGRLPTGTMNKTEARYAAHVAELQHAGEVAWFKFEGIKLRLADNTFYTCDFAVMTADGRLEAHEIKGFWTDDARVKIKVAASLFPFKFIAVTRAAGGWEREEF